MAKQKVTTRTGWNRNARAQRPAVASASPSGKNQTELRRPADTGEIRRMGPYETRYEIDFGYITQREVL